MSKTRASDELAGAIHQLLGKHLLEAFQREGGPTKDEIKHALDFLKQNRITCEEGGGEAGDTLSQLKQQMFDLPSFENDQVRVVSISNTNTH